MAQRALAALRQIWAAIVFCARALVASAVRLRRDAAYRERALGIGAFAFIFAFTIASIDYLITGGPDWNPGAPAIVQEAHAATIERDTRIHTRLAPMEMLDVSVPAALEEEIEIATLGADDLLGGPESFMAGADAVLQNASYDASGKPHRAALISIEAPMQHAPKVKEPAITSSEIASLW
jgi:hypothetical protein